MQQPCNTRTWHAFSPRMTLFTKWRTRALVCAVQQISTSAVLRFCRSSSTCGVRVCVCV